jgi:hypothetical protein
MARPVNPNQTTAGNDSFLDVVSNIVGILIILVLMTGVRIKQAAQPAPAGRGPELAAAAADNAALERDLEELVGQLRQVEAQAAVRRRERAMLATALATAERELAAQREQLDQNARRQYDAQRGLELARARLDELHNRRAQLAAVRPAVHEVQSYPTSLSKTVDGREAHFQLRGGRVAVVPLDDLIEKFKTHMRARLYKLKEQDELSDTVGPLGGFFLRYTVERVQVPVETALRSGQPTSYVQLRKFELIPVTAQLGEPLEEALASQSEFRGRLDSTNPRDWTITLWVYPDSFATYRGLRKLLYDEGYRVAARPLPQGRPISGSPQGTRSTSQ